MRHLCFILAFIMAGFLQSETLAAISSNTARPSRSLLQWDSLPDLPDEVGVAGPFAGVHGDALIVAGGANFLRPVWENSKVWHDRIHVLVKEGGGHVWKDGGRLPFPIAHGAAVTTPDGVVCMGGNDGRSTFRDVWLLAWDKAGGRLSISDYPPLPDPCAFGQAAIIGSVIYLAGGQSGNGLETATRNFWSLDLRHRGNPAEFAWKALPSWPGPPRSFNLTVRQHNGFNDCVYVMSGRSMEGGEVRFLRDVWEYNPITSAWRPRADAPRCVMAGLGIGHGQSHIFVMGGDDGTLFFKADELKDNHPGFPREALMYHTITDSWASAGAMPASHVATAPVAWGGEIVIPSGEVRPRVRSVKVWRVNPVAQGRSFGALDYLVIAAYLAAVVGLGLYFTRRNRNTEDFFRAGKQIPWWVAGCSIFATMLSSVTYTGLPSKAFAQDWAHAAGNFMIPVVAIVAVYAALPFYRRIDATSAYEYLEKRFSRAVRMFGSASFTLFHVFRMAVVMSLTGLALAVATPLTPAQSVILMGILSILYCAMGGIEAVVWTDTLQTFVLIGGAVVALAVMIAGVDGGFAGLATTALGSDKLRMANFHWDVSNVRIALWVILLGAVGQHLSSYTADQAVVQRYMTTPSERLAARSIWTNAILSVPATLLFFGLGTALHAYYRSHPGRLDPTISTDQIFPLFIASEMPAGLAGLIVAGIFAAAQSTVSTSMNSTATTVVTDFLRPWNACRSEAGYLRSARVVTVLMGVLGTAFGLVFVNPAIKSLFDQFIIVIGLFMGVLGGLFLLGVLTRRAHAGGALAGGLTGAAAMFCLWKFTSVPGYIYSITGIGTCFAVGYAASLILPARALKIEGLTIHTLRSRRKDLQDSPTVKDTKDDH